MHVDDFIDRFSSDSYARWMLLHFRLPGIHRMLCEKFMPDAKLFCTWEGKRFRVTGASRLGDVWLSEDYTRQHGYDHRVNVDECSEWGPDA